MLVKRRFQLIQNGAMPTLAVGMWNASEDPYMPTASVGMAPDIPQHS